MREKRDKLRFSEIMEPTFAFRVKYTANRPENQDALA